MEYIRKAYGVEAYRGWRIRWREKEGMILGGKNGRLRVRFDDESRTSLLHPTDGVTYL